MNINVVAITPATTIATPATTIATPAPTTLANTISLCPNQATCQNQGLESEMFSRIRKLNIDVLI